MKTTARSDPGSRHIHPLASRHRSACRGSGEQSGTTAPGRPLAIASLACWLLASLAAPVAAATLSFSHFFPLPAESGGGNPTSTAVFSVPQFDPSLGTLDAIDFELVRGILNFTWTFDNESAFDVFFLSNVNPSAFTRLAWFGGELAEFAQTVSFEPPFQAIAADSDGAPDFTGSDALTLSGAFPLLHEIGSLTDPMLLGAFTGTSSMFLEERVRFLPSNPHPGIYAHDASLAQSTGGVIWRYQYTPAVDPPSAVPEPASLVLVLSASMGLMVQAAGRRWMRDRRARTGSRTLPEAIVARSF
jgi:hypothetical protein